MKNDIEPTGENLENLGQQNEMVENILSTEAEIASLKESLKEVALIKQGKLQPLSMNDLWNE